MRDGKNNIVLVAKVMASSAAHALGIRAGDRVVWLNRLKCEGNRRQRAGGQQITAELHRKAGYTIAVQQRKGD